MAPSRPPPVEPHRCSFLLNAIKNTDDKRRAILSKRMKTTASSREVSHLCVGQTADSEELSLADQRTRETCSGRFIQIYQHQSRSHFGGIPKLKYRRSGAKRCVEVIRNQLKLTLWRERQRSSEIRIIMFALFVFEEHRTSLIIKGRHSKWSLNEKQHQNWSISKQ